jgi:hypothetical protein
MNKLFVTEKQFENRLSGTYEIRDAVMEKVDIQLIPHFGYLPCFYPRFNIGCPISIHNNISNLGFILHTFMQLFNLREDGVYISEWTDQRARLVYDTSDPLRNNCVAIGHPWEDKFIFIADLMAVTNYTM